MKGKIGPAKRKCNPKACKPFKFALDIFALQTKRIKNGLCKICKRFRTHTT